MAHPCTKVVVIKKEFLPIYSVCYKCPCLADMEYGLQRRADTGCKTVTDIDIDRFDTV